MTLMELYPEMACRELVSFDFMSAARSFSASGTNVRECTAAKRGHRGFYSDSARRPNRPYLNKRMSERKAFIDVPGAGSRKIIFRATEMA